MGKTKTRIKTTGELPIDPKKRLEKIYDILGLMKYKDLQRACISRGMKPEDVVKGDHNSLSHYFINHFDDPEDPNLLIEFDNWREDQMIQRGYKQGEALLHPDLRLGYVGKGDLSDVQVKPEAPKKAPPSTPIEKSKREKDSVTGVVKGTKKNLTYELALEGLEIDKVIDQVKEAFPEAEAKSIKIWYKRALKERNGDD